MVVRYSIRFWMRARRNSRVTNVCLLNQIESPSGPALLSPISEPGGRGEQSKSNIRAATEEGQELVEACIEKPSAELRRFEQIQVQMAALTRHNLKIDKAL